MKRLSAKVTNLITKCLAFVLIVSLTVICIPAFPGDSVRAEDTQADTVVYGTTFDAWANGLVNIYDPAGTEYTWTKESGTGEVEGGTLTDNGEDLKFTAVAAGDVTIRFDAVNNGDILRTLRKTYRIVYPYEYYDCRCINFRGEGFETYGSSEDLDLSAEYIASRLEPGASFDFVITTWAKDGRTEEPNPAKSDFTWSQSGAGSVKEITTPAEAYNYCSDNDILFSFQAVSVGDMTLTISSNDGNWSKDYTFRVRADLSNLKDCEIRKGKSLTNHGNGHAWWPVYFWFEDQRNHLKQFKFESSDESVAILDDVISNAEGGDWDFEIPIRILKAGTVRIRFLDSKYGDEYCSVKMTFTEEDALDCWKANLYCPKLQYGVKSYKVKAYAGDTVTFKIGGQELTKTVPSSGSVTFKDLPQVKTGTYAQVTFSGNEADKTITKKVKVTDTLASLRLSAVRPSSTKLTVTLRKAKKGDIIKIKAGSKTYRKKVSADTASFRFVQKIRKQKAGTTIKVTAYNRFKQVRCTKSVKVK